MIERVCTECHYPTAFETCGMCGKDLCPACFEMGGGFCSANHTQEQIDAYEEAFTGKPISEERKLLRKLKIL